MAAGAAALSWIDTIGRAAELLASAAALAWLYAAATRRVRRCFDRWFGAPDGTDAERAPISPDRP